MGNAKDASQKADPTSDEPTQGQPKGQATKGQAKGQTKDPLNHPQSPRPAAGEDAIARIANALGQPVEQVRWEFWHAWDGLRASAKFPDYLLVLTERRAVQALRDKKTHH